jgi:hypothetical protein
MGGVVVIGACNQAEVEVLVWRLTMGEGEAEKWFVGLKDFA